MGFLILFITTILIITIIYFLTDWSRRYGKIDGLFPMGIIEIPIRTKLKNWRDLIPTINLLYVSREFKHFFDNNRNYRNKHLLTGIDIVFPNFDDGEFVRGYREYCYNELGYMYIIKVNILKIHKERIKTNQFVDMIIDEYKKLHDEYYSKK